MKKSLLTLLLVLIFTIGGFAQSNVNAGVSIGPEGLKSFYLSVSEHFKVAEKEVTFVHERKIKDEELPVVFFIAARAKVDPKVIVDLRIGGSSWYSISVKYGIYPDVYYVPLTFDPGPPYGKAYGYYKNKPKQSWEKIKLSDDDIINLVNLKFIVEHYNYTPDKVIKMRSEGKNFVLINENVKNERKADDKGNKGKESTNGKKNK
jgi:hypothetical protein